MPEAINKVPETEVKLEDILSDGPSFAVRGEAREHTGLHKDLSKDAVSSLDAFAVSALSGFESNFVNSLVQLLERPYHEATSKNFISPEESKKLYGLKTDEYLPQEYVASITKKEQTIQAYNQIVDRYTKNTGDVLPKILGTITGFISDPTLLALGWAVPASVLKAGTSGFKSARTVNLLLKISKGKAPIGTNLGNKLSYGASKFAKNHFLKANIMAESVVGIGVDYSLRLAEVQRTGQEIDHKSTIGWAIAGGVLGGVLAFGSRKSVKAYHQAIKDKGSDAVKETIEAPRYVDPGPDLEDVELPDTSPQGDVLDTPSSDVPEDSFTKQLIETADDLPGEINPESAKLANSIVDYSDLVGARGKFGKELTQGKHFGKILEENKVLRDLADSEPSALGFIFSDRLFKYLDDALIYPSLVGDIDIDDAFKSLEDSYKKAVSQMYVDERFHHFYIEDGVLNPKVFDMIPEDEFIDLFGQELKSLTKADFASAFDKRIKRSYSPKVVDVIDAKVDAYRTGDIEAVLDLGKKIKKAEEGKNVS